MPDLKLKQFNSETDTWRRLLGFMIEENVFLKNRVTEIIRDGVDKPSLDEIENFYSRFLKQDELIDLLRLQVVELEKLLKRENFVDGLANQLLEKKLKIIRKDMEHAEQHFSRLKSEFNSYLSENM